MPFSGISGNSAAKIAVMCLLADRSIRCLLVTGAPGTGKTALIRSISSIDPSVPVVNVPVGVTEDRLFGTVDIEKALGSGAMRMERGLFHEADGGVICIDDVDLLDIRTALEAVETAVTGTVDIEKDGLSASYRTDASLAATASCNVRAMDGHLADRFDMCVRMTRPKDGEHIRSLMTCMRLADGDASILEELSASDHDILRTIETARRMLPETRLLKRHRNAIARLCIRYGVGGYRGPVSCARTAVALAALDGRKKTSDDDIVLAAELCLDHRRTVFETEKKEVREQERSWAAYDMIRFVHDNRGMNTNASIVDSINSDEPVAEASEEVGEDAAPEDGIEAKVGRRFDVIDIMEAADSRGREDGKRMKRFVESPSGRYSGARTPKGACSDIAIDATLRAAAPHQTERSHPSGGVRIEKSDIREKIRTRRMEQVFYFMVDSSGSLIIRNRISKVKAAILSMLRLHYEKRDRVGLMTFNEEVMEEVMPPTRAVSEISKAVEDIRIGCGTPLSQALMACWGFVQSYTRRHPEGFVHVVLFTDGKATRSLDPDADPCEEALRICGHLAADNVDWIVVDTGLGTTKSEMPENLADALEGRLFMLDDLDSNSTVEGIWNAGSADIRAPDSLPLWERDRARGFRRGGIIHYRHRDAAVR